MEISAKDYRNFRKDFIATRRQELDALEKLEIGRFDFLEIDCLKINALQFRALISALDEKKVTNKSSVLYYFTFEGGSSAVIDKVKTIKNQKSKKIALPKVNEHSNSNVLYVGKTNNGFFTRLGYHLGVKGKTVYALHLSEWAPEIDLKIKLYFTTLNLEDEKLHLLEMMESVLHRGLMPVLGREGH